MRDSLFGARKVTGPALDKSLAERGRRWMSEARATSAADAAEVERWKEERRRRDTPADASMGSGSSSDDDCGDGDGGDGD